jgi:hypothetical protein
MFGMPGSRVPIGSRCARVPTLHGTKNNYNYRLQALVKARRFLFFLRHCSSAMMGESKAQPKFSKRGWATVEGIMPKIKDVVAERLKKANTNIDLSTAENWLLRPELVALCKDAVAHNLSARVRHFGECNASQSCELILLQALFIPKRILGRSRASRSILEVFQRVLQATCSSGAFPPCYGAGSHGMCRHTSLQHL